MIILCLRRHFAKTDVCHRCGFLVAFQLEADFTISRPDPQWGNMVRGRPGTSEKPGVADVRINSVFATYSLRGNLVEPLLFGRILKRPPYGLRARPSDRP